MLYFLVCAGFINLRAFCNLANDGVDFKSSHNNSRYVRVIAKHNHNLWLLTILDESSVCETTSLMAEV